MKPNKSPSHSAIKRVHIQVSIIQISESGFTKTRKEPLRIYPPNLEFSIPAELETMKFNNIILAFGLASAVASLPNSPSSITNTYKVLPQNGTDHKGGRGGGGRGGGSGIWRWGNGGTTLRDNNGNALFGAVVLWVGATVIWGNI